MADKGFNSPYDCPECGEVHPYGCHAHANVKDDDGRIIGKRPCRKPAMKGLTVCASHGGRSPRARDAGERRTQQERIDGQVAKALARYEDLAGDLPEVDPLDALLTAVSVAARMVAYLRSEVSALDKLWARDHLADARPEVHVGMLRDWTECLGRLSRAALDAGIAERQVRLAEQQAELLLAVIDGILDDLQLSASQRKRAPDVVRTRLTLVAS